MGNRSKTQKSYLGKKETRRSHEEMKPYPAKKGRNFLLLLLPKTLILLGLICLLNGEIQKTGKQIGKVCEMNMIWKNEKVEVFFKGIVNPYK